MFVFTLLFTYAKLKARINAYVLKALIMKVFEIVAYIQIVCEL